MKGDLVAVGVLSGNRNFEGRIHPMTRANYLASPPLVIAYALAGSVLIDFDNEPIGESVIVIINNITRTHTHLFNGPLSGTTRVSLYQKGKTNLDFTEAGDSEWQWHQLGHVQVCTLLQTDNHASTPPLSFFHRPDALPAAQPTASKH